MKQRLGRSMMVGIATVVAAATASAPAASDPTTAAKPKVKEGRVTKLKTRRASAPLVSEGQQATVTATCPKGTSVLGGGFSSGHSGTADGITSVISVHESRREGSRTWLVSGVRQGDGPTHDLFVEAYCHGGGRKVSEASGTFTIPGGDATGTATATCPRDKHAISGGFSFPPPGYLPPEDRSQQYENYRPTPRSWSASLHNVGATAKTITAYAYCRQGRKAPKRTGEPSVVRMGLPFPGPLTGECPEDRLPAGGGYQLSSPAPTTFSPLVFASTAQQRRWAVVAAGILGSGTLKTFAYCG